MQNRLGIIRTKQGLHGPAIDHFQKAIELDHDLFSPAISLASAYLDLGDAPSAENLLPQLKAKARTPSDASLLRHTEARVAFSKKDLELSRDLLKQEVLLFHNVIPNLGLLVRVECALFDRDFREFPAVAALSLKSAETALGRIVALDQSNQFIETLSLQIEERKNVINRGKTVGKAPGFPKSALPTTSSPNASSPSKISGPSSSQAPTPPLCKVPDAPQRKPPLKTPLMPPMKPPFKR